MKPLFTSRKDGAFALLNVRRAGRFVALALLAFIATGPVFSAALAAVGMVTISLPPKFGVIQSAVPDSHIGFTKKGYVEEEFFFTGLATRYAQSGTWTSSGFWTAVPAAQEPYTSRLIVRRPTNPRKFNGIVIVEWLNVSRGFDAEASFPQTWPILLREGYAWVGVSAQKLGLDALKRSDRFGGDPLRYAAITSGSSDGFSYDIFSQAGNAVLAQADLLLSGLEIKRIVAMGTSQSANRLVTYVNAVHPVAGVFDGFYIHARISAGGTPLNNGGPPGTTISVPSPSMIRSDLDVPVFTVISETDATVSFPARQPDSAMFRLWEVAGSSHAPRFRNRYSNAQQGVPVDDNPCETLQNDMPSHYVFQAALSHLKTWIATGTPPASMPLLDIQGTPPSVQRDQYGNAIGGVRLPHIDVPIARYAPQSVVTSTDPLAQLICPLAGVVDYWSNDAKPATPPTDLWPKPSLKTLYRDHGKYVSAFAQATRDAVRAGYLLEPDAEEAKQWAAQSSVGK